MVLYDEQILDHHVRLLEGLLGLQKVCNGASFLLVAPFATLLSALCTDKPLLTDSK